MGRPKLNPDTVEKTCPQCNKTFSVSFYLRNRRTYCSKKCSTNSPEVIKKMAESQTKTFNEKYGMHPMKTEQTKENLKEAVKKKYGVEWISQKDGWYDTVKKNNLIKYGTESYNNIEKRKLTCLDRYGVDNYRLTDEYEKKYKETCLLKYGLPHASMSLKFKIEHGRSMFTKFMEHPNFVNFTPMFTLEDYKGVFIQDYSFKCKRCQTIKSYSLDHGHFPICPSCDQNNCSTFQNEVYEYIKLILGNEVDIRINDRTILNPKELDLVIPSLNLAIECDSILWHSEVFGRKHKMYHLHKTSNAIARCYRVVHIFDNEWRDKQEIVKSILATIVKKTPTSIYGRDCIIREISSDECICFLEVNHLQGKDTSAIKIGLFDIKTDELISVMTFMKSRFDSHAQYEMGRFCNKLGYNVVGGASKLFTYFLKTYKPTSIVSYSDRRYFDGQVHLNLGFTFVGNSTPSYYYIIDNYQNIQHRMAWRKQNLPNRLEKFDPLLSEWENMKANGYDRIWDCGTSKWVYYPQN